MNIHLLTTPLEVIKMTTSSVASDENLIKMTVSSFQCINSDLFLFGAVSIRQFMVPYVLVWLNIHKSYHMHLSELWKCIFQHLMTIWIES